MPNPLARVRLSILVGLAALFVTTPTPSPAWGPQGHHLVGAIADDLLNANARQQVHNILGYDLATAATWPDCVRSVVHSATDGTFVYNSSTPYQAPCDPFMTPASEIHRMEHYASRNWDNCAHDPGNPCSASYHFDDVAVQRSSYEETDYGTNNHDVVHAILAAIAVLQGQPAPAPFSIVDKKEALFLLAHFVGDIHQPLHVGAVYLSPTGKRVDPDSATGDVASTATRGGNWIKFGTKNLHSTWDGIPASWDVDVLTAAQRTTLDNRARSVAASTGPVATWPAEWASDTVMTSHAAFAGLKFKSDPNGHWTATAIHPTTYRNNRTNLQKAQILKAGARLAELLNAIWP